MSIHRKNKRAVFCFNALTSHLPEEERHDQKANMFAWQKMIKSHPKLKNASRLFIHLHIHVITPIDHFKIEVKVLNRRFPISNRHPTHCWYQESLRIRGCEPMCQIRKIRKISYFLIFLIWPLGHKQNIITCDHTSASIPLSLIGYFGHLKSKFYF